MRSCSFPSSLDRIPAVLPPRRGGKCVCRRLGRDPAAATRPPSRAGSLPPGRCRLGLPPRFPPCWGLCFLGQPQDPRRPARPLCIPLSSSGIPKLWSWARRPVPGSWAGREGGRQEAGRPPKSAPSCMWEAVAVTQVSRGPRAWRERARAAPLCAVTIVKSEKPLAAPQAAFPGPSCAPPALEGRKA